MNATVNAASATTSSAVDEALANCRGCSLGHDLVRRGRILGHGLSAVDAASGTTSSAVHVGHNLVSRGRSLGYDLGHLRTQPRPLVSCSHQAHFLLFFAKTRTTKVAEDAPTADEVHNRSLPALSPCSMTAVLREEGRPLRKMPSPFAATSVDDAPRPRGRRTLPPLAGAAENPASGGENDAAAAAAACTSDEWSAERHQPPTSAHRNATPSFRTAPPLPIFLDGMSICLLIRWGVVIILGCVSGAKRSLWELC